MTSQLPIFSFSNRVTAKSGKQDKIDIRFSWGELHGSLDALDAWRRTLGAGWLFNRPEQTRTSRRPLTTRQRPVPGSALFSGTLAMSDYYRARNSSKLQLSLYLNPTRFARHQTPRFSLAGESQIQSDRLTFRHRVLPSTFRGEFGLDEGGNWIPDSMRYSHFYGPSVWTRLLRNYLEGVIETIREELEDAGRINDVTWETEEESTISFRYVETYWEFGTPDPLKTVSLCESLLKRFSENPSRGRVFKTFVEGSTTHNSRSFAVQVRTGVLLVVYAKTNRRVRVEVRHELNKCAHVVGRRVQARGIPELLTKINAARRDAAEIVNAAFTFMESRSTFPEQSASVAQFLFDLVQAVGHWEGAGTLLSMLVENKKIVTDANIKQHVHALKKAGLIKAQATNRRRRYLITERYEQALQELALGNKNLLGPRKRKRETS